MAAAACPNCRDPMELLALASRHASVEVDACYACHAFWFDRMESPALSPESVLHLFSCIREHRDAQRQALGVRMACPRCNLALVKTHDLQGTNRLEYFRCPDGCGRFTTFFQFLREKQFVRSLSAPELKQLRVQVSQVRCSSCGAAVALDKGSACTHCGAAVSILDADAVEKTVARLKAPRKAAEPASIRRTMDDQVFRESHASDAYDVLTDAIESVSEWFTK